jgi:predicted dehydrogenase
VDEKRLVAILGAGRICARHIKAIRSTGVLDVSWVVSRTPERAAAVAAEHGVAHHATDPAEALADPDVDAVVVAYPTQDHARLTMAAFAAGKDVVCEKPLAWTAEEARAVLAMANARGRRLAVCHIRRYWAPCVRLKELSLRLGALRRVSWNYRAEQHWPEGWRTQPPGGYLLDAHVHDADLLRWLLGRDPVSVYAHGCNRADGGGLLHFLAADGAAASFDWDGAMAGRSYPHHVEHHAEVLGALGWARLTITGEDVSVEHFIDGMDGPLTDHALIADAVAGSWPLMWAAFARYLATGEQPSATAADGAIAVEMILGAVRALESGAIVPLVSD